MQYDSKHYDSRQNDSSQYDSSAKPNIRQHHTRDRFSVKHGEAAWLGLTKAQKKTIARRVHRREKALARVGAGGQWLTDAQANAAGAQP